MNDRICFYSQPFSSVQTYYDMIDVSAEYGMKYIEGFNMLDFAEPDIEAAKKIRKYADEKGVNTVLRLIESHFHQGGTLININILDKEKLLEAHENPESHPDLVVRVTGFTAYFASLSPQFRQLVVDRFLEGV